MNVLEYIIRAKDETKAGIASARDKLSSMVKDVGAGLAKIGIAAAGVAAVIKTVQSALVEAFQAQRATAQFKTLLGSMEKALEHMEKLKRFQHETAGGMFQFEDISKASQSLEKLTDGALSGSSAMRLVGDVAAATGNSMQSVSFAVGKAFGQLAEGMPIDRALMQLQQLGVLGPDTINTLKEMESRGASMAEKWDVVQKALERYKGGMDDFKNTAAGVAESLKATLGEALETLGQFLSKGVIQLRDFAAALGALAGGASLKDVADQLQGISAPSDPYIKTEARYKEEQKEKAAMRSTFEKAEKRQTLRVAQKLVEDQAKAGAKVEADAINRTNRNLLNWGDPGGFERWQADPNADNRLGMGFARRVAEQGMPAAMAAALARIGDENRVGFAFGNGPADVGGIGGVHSNLNPTLKRMIDENLGRPKQFRVLDAEGFEDRAAEKLGQKIIDGKKLTPAERAQLDPRVLDQAQEERFKRLTDKVAHGGRMTREEGRFMEQQKAWKKALEDQRQQQKDAMDKARKHNEVMEAAEQKRQEGERLKLKALDLIAANTNDLPALVKAIE